LKGKGGQIGEGKRGGIKAMGRLSVRWKRKKTVSLFNLVKDVIRKRRGGVLLKGEGGLDSGLMGILHQRKEKSQKRIT